MTTATSEPRLNVSEGNEILQVAFADVWWNQLFDPKTGTYTSDDNTRGAESFANPLSDFEESFGKPKHKKTPTGLSVLLVTGYDTTVGNIPHVFELTKIQGQQAVKQRKEQIALWRQIETDDYQTLAKVAERVWGLVDAEGKAVAAKNVPLPKYGGNMGFRRGYATMGAIVLRESITFPIPVQIVQYESGVERTIAHLRENEMKTAGSSKLAPLDYVLAAVQIVDEGGRESALTDAGVTRGTAQKVYAFAELNARFRKLKLAQRVEMTPPTLGKGVTRYPYSEGCYIPFSVLDKEGMRKLARGSKDIAAASKPDEVESYIAAAMRGVAQSTRMMSRKDVESRAEKHICDIVRIVCEAVATNDASVFTKLVKVGEALNDATHPILAEIGLVEETPVEE